MNTFENLPVGGSAGGMADGPYPGYSAELLKRQEHESLADRANAATLPGSLRDAFASDPPQLHGYTLQPVTMGLHPILVRLNSPLLEVVRIMREEMARTDEPDLAKRQARAGERAAKEVTPDEEAVIETVYCFITPAAEIRALLARGRDHFRETVMREFGEKIHPREFAELQQLVSAHYVRSFITAIQHKAPASGEKSSSLFTVPPADGRTASAGGSTSSAR